MPSDDPSRVVRIYRSDMVKVKKEKKCAYCGAPIYRYQYAVAEHFFLNKKIIHQYFCLDCVEDFVAPGIDLQEANRKRYERMKENGMDEHGENTD